MWFSLFAVSADGLNRRNICFQTSDLPVVSILSSGRQMYSSVPAISTSVRNRTNKRYLDNPNFLFIGKYGSVTLNHWNVLHSALQ